MKKNEKTKGKFYILGKVLSLLRFKQNRGLKPETHLIHVGRARYTWRDQHSDTRLASVQPCGPVRNSLLDDVLLAHHPLEENIPRCSDPKRVVSVTCRPRVRSPHRPVLPVQHVVHVGIRRTVSNQRVRGQQILHLASTSREVEIKIFSSLLRV